jgi:FAD/FMN-containing dehydrogenase
LRVEAGATWAQVIKYLSPRGRTVQVMQASNVFSVGGTLSVNAHGRSPGIPPFASTVKWFRIMMADGHILTCSRTDNADLFRHVIGGYGLFGVILDVDIKTIEDVPTRMNVELIAPDQLADKFHAVVSDQATRLAYGRLAPDGSEVLFHTLRRVDGFDEPAGFDFERSTAMTRVRQLIIELCKRIPGFMNVRWWLEKRARGDGTSGKLSSFLDMGIDDLRQLMINEGQETDILVEVFVPQQVKGVFEKAFIQIQAKHQKQTLNDTIRHVAEDRDTVLPYAKSDSHAHVLYYNQHISTEGEKAQNEFERELYDLVLGLDGTFYLPYRLSYTTAQLRRAYPNIDAFFAFKRKVDPEELFTNLWYEAYGRQPDH